MTIIFIVLGAVVVVALVALVMLRKGGDDTPSVARPSVSPGMPQAPGTEPGAKVNWLKGTAGEVDGRLFHIGYRTATIGRGTSNLIQVMDDQASRVHCQLTPREGWLQVVDMKSQNGTFINGAPAARGRLNEGDELRIGGARFVFQVYSFEDRDDALLRKNAGKTTASETVADDGQTFELIIEATLKETGGDVEAAAKKLGVQPAVLAQIIKGKGIKPSPR